MQPVRQTVPRTSPLAGALRAGTLALFALALLAAGCAPRVEVAAPSEPIEINLNVKIQHEIVVKVDQDLEDLFDEEDDLF